MGTVHLVLPGALVQGDLHAARSLEGVGGLAVAQMGDPRGHCVPAVAVVAGWAALWIPRLQVLLRSLLLLSACARVCR